MGISLGNKEENDTIDFIILTSLTILAFILRFFFMSKTKIIVNGMYIILTIRIMIFYSRSKIIVNKRIVIWMLFCIIVMVNAMQNGVSKGMVKSIIDSTKGIILFSYLLFLLDEKKDCLYRFFRKILYPFMNIYFYINVPIIFLQIKTRTFLMKRALEYNAYTPDQITGLIGYNGTHILSFFWVTLILINLFNYLKSKKLSILVNTICQVILMILISSQNDNTVFFYIAPLTLIQFLLFNKIQVNIKKVLKIIFIGIISFNAIYFIINANQVLKEQLDKFVETRVIIKYEQLISGESDTDEERIQLFKYSLEYGNGYGFGKGIGSVNYGDSKMPRHFGMSEISIKTYEGGLIYLAVLNILWTVYLTSILTCKLNYKNKLMTFLVVLVNVVLLCSYTQIFYDQYLIFFMGIHCVMYNLFDDFNSKEVRME